MIEYILKGLSHYIYLLIKMLDFRDNGFMIIIVVGIILICINDKSVYKSVISVVKSLYCILKTKLVFFYCNVNIILLYIHISLF